MLTGDNEGTARAIGRETGVADVRSELLPLDKVETVERLVECYGGVAVIGDGVNDAPAMGRATLGIAMGSAGSDAAIEAADVALMSDDLSRLPWLIRHSRRTLAVIHQNVFFALGVKLAVFALATAGLATLWMAIAADMGASRRRIRGILAAGLGSGLALGVAGLRPDAWLIGGALFVMMSGIPVINACSQAIWQRKVPPEVQGRVFSVRRMIAQFTEPVGYLLAERLFEPLMAEGGPLAATLGSWIGSGPGRGIGLLFLCLAAIQVLGTLAIYGLPRVCRVEEELTGWTSLAPPRAPASVSKDPT